MAREQFQNLSEQMYYILLSLWEEQCGADISRRVIELSRGRLRIGPGTLYTLLGRFEEQKIIRQTVCEGRKRYYIITEKGRQMLITEYRRLQALVQEGAPYLEKEENQNE